MSHYRHVDLNYIKFDFSTTAVQQMIPTSHQIAVYLSVPCLTKVIGKIFATASELFRKLFHGIGIEWRVSRT